MAMQPLVWVEIDEQFDPEAELSFVGHGGNTVRAKCPVVNSEVVYAAVVAGGTHYRIVHRDISQVHLKRVQLPNQLTSELVKKYGDVEAGAYVLTDEVAGEVVETTVAAYFVPDAR